MRDLREKLDDLLYLLNDSRYVKVDNDHEMIFIWNGYATITVLDIENFSDLSLSTRKTTKNIFNYFARFATPPVDVIKKLSKNQKILEKGLTRDIYGDIL